MYVKSLYAYNFRCFGKAELHLQHPGRNPNGSVALPNVNLLLGNNGAGKSSILRALAIATLAPILSDSGFVPYRLVRRPSRDAESLLKVKALLDPNEREGDGRKEIELLARLRRWDRSNADRLTAERTPHSPVTEFIFDEGSPAFFVVGYGATRRVEAGDYSESSARKSRGLRYQRVASLFEDHLALQTLQSWLPKVSASRRREVVSIFNAMLPTELRFNAKLEGRDEQYLFEFRGKPTPFLALADGHKAFIGWIGDLLGRLSRCCPARRKLADISGLVLIDEIDLHLHPEWQRSVVPRIAQGLPRLQFVMTSHSPIVVGTLQHENIFVAETEPGGEVMVKQLEERVHGKSAEQVLLSSYFKLKTTRSESFADGAEDLFQRAAKGESAAALEYLRQLAGESPSSTADRTRNKSKATKQGPASGKKKTAEGTGTKRKERRK